MKKSHSINAPENLDNNNNSKVVPIGLSGLKSCIEIISCCSSECERGCSLTIIIIIPVRTNLVVIHVSSLLFIKLHGQSLDKLEPELYVQTCLRSHHMTADDTRTRITKHPTEKKNIFFLVIRKLYDLKD